MQKAIIDLDVNDYAFRCGEIRQSAYFSLIKSITET